MTYLYNDAAHKHAVTQAGANYFCYDQNSNMTRRNATSSACTNGDTLVYDQENRLTSITVGGTTTTYTYDGDGNRVKKTVNGVSTFYIGNHYEVTNGTALKYYYPSIPHHLLSVNDYRFNSAIVGHRVSLGSLVASRILDS